MKNTNDALKKITDDVVGSYDIHGGINHIEGCTLPSQNSVKEIIDTLMDIFFPGFFTSNEISGTDLKDFTLNKITALNDLLTNEIIKSLKFQHRHQQDSSDNIEETIAKKSAEESIFFLNKIPEIRKILKTDVEAFYDSDPAAASHEEVIVSYPGIFAIAVYRAAHELFNNKIPLIPRIMTEYAHTKTGIDIHPGANIGKYFFIDHGTGVVIGETSIIGERCRIYQGVTLGALKIEFNRDDDGKVIECNKRHPTLEDDVTIYSGATILGGKTILKKGTLIGGNAWVTSTTEAGDKVVFDTSNTQKVFKK
ncbi:MAG: serine acetyltransferase [Planctomycetota bacterium]|nr:MAG: serine acetyltransferase [Planctomycetota bacterium]